MHKTKSAQRLTEEMQIGPFAALKDKAEAVPGAFGTYDCLYAHMVAVTRLKQYEDAMPLERAQELSQAEKDGRLVILQSNDPLTVEQIRKMGGEPYWHVGLQEDSAPPHWNILDPFYARHIEDYGYGKRWIAYRRKKDS